MHTRRLTTLILGLWVGLTVSMLFVATQNFRGVDRLLAEPHKETTRFVEHAGPEATRALLRHQVAELNRFFFGWFGSIQIGMGLLLLVTLLFATNGNKLLLSLAGFALALTLFEKLLLEPQINVLGRALDFLSSVQALELRDRFQRFHLTFSVAELMKLLLLGAVGFRMLSKRSGPARISRSTRDLAEESVTLR